MGKLPVSLLEVLRDHIVSRPCAGSAKGLLAQPPGPNAPAWAAGLPDTTATKLPLTTSPSNHTLPPSISLRNHPLPFTPSAVEGVMGTLEEIKAGSNSRVHQHLDTTSPAIAQPPLTPSVVEGVMGTSEGIKAETDCRYEKQKPSSAHPELVEGFMGTLLHNKQLEVVEDKELACAMPPRFDLAAYTQLAKEQTPFQDLGSGAWLADLDNMPFTPPQIAMLTEQAAAQPFSAGHFALALYNGAHVLYIPKNSNLEIKLQDLQMCHASVRSTSSAMNIELLIIIVEGGADVTITDNVGAYAFQARAVFGHIGDSAQVRYVNDYQYGKEAFGIEHEQWQIASGGQLTRIGSVMGGVQSWHTQEYALGQHASVEQIMLSALRGTEQAALTTKQHHQGMGSKSSVLIKSVLLDESQSFYRGTIAIKEQAKLSEAHQQQRALILSSQARTCAIPSLEVATHDVRCSHGSAAGRFNEQEMLYLRARGLDKEQAERLLIKGFFNDERLANYGRLTDNLTLKLVERCNAMPEAGAT